jgi:hypothetical protein
MHNAVRVDDEVNPSPYLLASLLLNKAGRESRLDILASGGMAKQRNWVRLARLLVDL